MQPRFSIHHLVPVMVLPAIVAAGCVSVDTRPARSVDDGMAGLRRRCHCPVDAPIAAGGAVVKTGRERISQRVGTTMQAILGVPCFGASPPPVPNEWDPRCRSERYGGSPVAWLRYARQVSISDSTNFVLGLRETPATTLASARVQRWLCLYVRDERSWSAMRQIHPPSTLAGIYFVSQKTLFGADQPGTIDLRRFASRFAHKLGWRRAGGTPP